MTMVEVDPKLFIKCRLCLEDYGTYQIVPSVREQISYCFEINVEPFDGLPQLICKKCQLILCEYTNTKKLFTLKQDELKSRTLGNNLPEETGPDNSAPALAVKRENTQVVATYENKRRKISMSSTSSHHSECNHESNKENIKVLNKIKDWTKKCEKKYVCRICNSKWLTKKSVINHQVTHKTLQTKYADIFNKYCSVKLQKCDSKPNITGSINQVVYNKNQIIAEGNANYYVSYKFMEKNYNSDSDNESNKNVGNYNSDESSDSSFKANELKRNRISRRRRICSTSSNETVVLENESNRKSQDNECINIDDTDSDDDKQKKAKNNKNFMNAVAKLITITHNKYLKKHEKPERPSIDQLNRKITSIGRQIINKPGFSCTRLIKYMEHMNLNVIWLARSPRNLTSNTNFFKIIPRYRYSTEKNINSFEGYEKKYNKPIESRKEVQITETRQESHIVEPRVEISLVAAPDVRECSESTSHQLYSETTLIATCVNTNGSNISSDHNMYETQKLLNANPVANPRQLPKKFINEAKKDKAKPLSMLTLEVSSADNLSEVLSSRRESNMQMPIIAFTTSLAPQALHMNESSNNIFANNTSCNLHSEISSPPAPVPRIKVKSVAELMSKETLSRMNEATPVVQCQQISQKGAVFSYGEHEIQNVLTTVQNNTISSNNCNDFVILDTVEFPNTRTKSPFKYLRMLLQSHNLILLDTDATLTREYHALLKFKVLYKQETKDQPVILCLSLFCLYRSFCLKIKDRNEENIDISKISPNWQWEILKIYRGDVVGKLLSNAKKISQEVYDNTNRFLCLLKSINVIA